jgi:hypothetical protein
MNITYQPRTNGPCFFLYQLSLLIVGRANRYERNKAAKLTNGAYFKSQMDCTVS